MPTAGSMPKDVYNAYNREYRKKNAEKIRAYKREYNTKWRKENGYHNELISKARYPDKEKARRILQKALMKGAIQKENCIVCKDENSQAHHEDYTKPLEVIWLCPVHHMERHDRVKTSTMTEEEIKEALAKVKHITEEAKKEQEKRNQRVVKLRSQGLTYTEIAKRFRFTRQRAQQIIKNYQKKLST